jgi:hypothetical protein
MQECVKNPMPADEVELLHKIYRTGPYSESYKPEILKLAFQKCVDNHSHKTGKSKQTKKPGQGTGTGKLQLEEERKKLIAELENG